MSRVQSHCASSCRAWRVIFVGVENLEPDAAAAAAAEGVPVTLREVLREVSETESTRKRCSW